MYLDTKNLVSCSNDDAHFQSKSYKKSRKAWKPLLKLLSSTTKSSKKDIIIAHPNNINLNNSHNQHLVEHAAAAAAAAPTTELPPNEPKKKQAELYVSLPPTPTEEVEKKEIAIISSASINKVTDTSCLHCIYGRNCQHLQKHSQQQQQPAITTTLFNDINKNLLPQNDCGVNGLTLALSTAQAHLIEEELINLLLNYHIQ